jgi:myo-inositol-1(or 4)-monophosphatase
VFIVDPIDGTRGFMEGDPRFAVSIALVIDGRPVAGFVEAPALKQTFSAVVGQGAFCNGVRLAASGRATPEGGLLAGPKMLIDKMAPRLRMSAQPKVPSLAVRFAHVASGALDAGIATPNSHDWDIAAADLVLAEAGGRLTSLDGRGLTYNRAETRHGALLAAPKALHDEILSVLAAFAGPEKDGQSRAPAQIER